MDKKIASCVFFCMSADSPTEFMMIANLIDFMKGFTR